MKKLMQFLVVLALLVGTVGPALASESDFTIQAGDLLQITVWKEDGMDREILVLPDGTISFPLIGSLKVQGMTLASAQTTIKEKLQPTIPDAAVTVMVKAPLGHKVSVLGQVTKPGEVMITSRMSAMQAISQAGGLTPFASDGNIIVIRQVNGEKQSMPYPFDDISRGRHLEKDFDLKPGDVVFVPTAGLL